jgi:hypothetical protein
MLRRMSSMGRLGKLRRMSSMGRLGMPRRMSSMDSYGQARHSKEDEQYGWYTGRLGMLWWKSSLATVQCGQAGHAIGRVSSVEYDR